MNYWSPKEARGDFGVVAAADWSADHRASSRGGLLALALATVISFAAGVGSTLFYLQVDRGGLGASVPLIEADKTPTRVRPEGLDINGKRIATSGSITSPAMAMSDPEFSLPIQGIPEPLEIAPPSQWQDVARLAPAVVPETRPALVTTEASAAAPVEMLPTVSPIRIQLASMRTAGAATNELDRLSRLFANELSAVDLAVERADLGPRGVYYRVLSAPIADRPAAADLCAALAARRTQCMVMTMTGGATRVQSAQPAAQQPEMRVQEAAAIAPVVAQPAADTAAQAPTVLPTAVPNGVRAQLASLRSLEGATRELNRLSRLYPELEQATLSVSRVDLGERGIFYRVLTAPFPDRSAAGELCHRLGANQAGCVLIAQRSKAA